MIVKVFSKHSLKEDTDLMDIAYWNGKTPKERWSAVQSLREQFYGRNERVERVISMRKLRQSPEDALPLDEFRRKYPSDQGFK